MSVSLFEPRWVFCPAGYVETLEMHLCGFWLASGKKCQMTLGDSSLIWIQVISLESEVKVPQSCPPLGDPVGYTVHGILQARILEWSLSLLQGIFPVQGLNPGFPHCRQILYKLSHKRNSRIRQWVVCPFCSGSAFPTQESNRGLLHGRRILYQLSYQGSPVSLKANYSL